MTWDQGGLQPPWFTLLLAGALGVVYLLLGPAPEALLFARDAIQAGETGRLVTGHLVHAGRAHLAWNLAALVLLGALFERLERPSVLRYGGLLLTGGLVIDAWIWWLEPDLGLYCGLSGVLNSLFAALGVALWRQTRHPLFLLALAGAVAKIVVEAAMDGALLPTSSWTSVPGVHLAGFAAGLLYAWVGDISASFRRCALESPAVAR